ncbi:MAG TPA: hypothetical protein PK857_12650, partial [Hyphomicrobium sp.]|nr:hypothetical protein [Hyphomicrobium sp.]
MSIKGLCARAQSLAALAMAAPALAAVAASSAFSAGKLIAVEWSDPEIKSFVSAHRDAAARSL